MGGSTNPEPVVAGINGGNGISFNYTSQLVAANFSDLSKYNGFTVSFFVYPRSCLGDNGTGNPHWIYEDGFLGITCTDVWVNGSATIHGLGGRVNNSDPGGFTRPPFILNDWNQAALSYNSSNGNMYYYQDGKFIGSMYVGNLTSSAISNLFIGGSGGSPWDGDGIISNVHVYAGSIQ